MNEVLHAIASVKSDEARIKILEWIVDNELSKKECKEIAIKLIESKYNLKVAIRILLNNGKEW